MTNCVDLQGYLQCTKMLYGFGYRIDGSESDEKKNTPKDDPDGGERAIELSVLLSGDGQKEKVNTNTGNPEILPGEEEWIRQKNVIDSPYPDQVRFRKGYFKKLYDTFMSKVSKLLAMQAYAKPHYLALGLTEDKRVDNDIKDEVVEDLEKLDPLRRALRLARKAEDFDLIGGRTSNLDSNYKAIKDELDTFACSILTQCKDMTEVKTILEHRPVCTKTTSTSKQSLTKTKPFKQSNLMKALWEGRKDFVAHAYFQEYFNQQMAGDVVIPRDTQYRAVQWCLIYVPYALLLFCCYPIVVFADFFRQADILFEKKQEEKGSVALTLSHIEEGRLSSGRSSKVNEIFSFFRGKMHTPDFRMTVYMAIQVLYMITLIFMMWNPTNNGTVNSNHCKEVHVFHYIVLVVTAILVIEESLDFGINLLEKEKAAFFESFWNVWSIAFRLILLVGLSVYLGACDHPPHRAEDENVPEAGFKNRAFLSGNDVLNVSSTLICLGVAAEFFKVLQFLLLFHCFGPLVICVINVAQSALKTLPIYIIIFSTYGMFMWGMFKPFHEAIKNNKEGIEQQFDFKDADAAESKDGLFHALFWKILAANPNSEGVQWKQYTEEATNMTKRDSSPIHEFSNIFILFAWAA